MTEKTIFKRIIDGEIPAKIVYEDKLCLAFEDVAPKAPTHILIIPRKEIASVTEASDNDELLLGHLLLVARNLTDELGINNGYRLVINTGKDAGQTVPHLHIHLLAGRELSWPPG